MKNLDHQDLVEQKPLLPTHPEHSWEHGGPLASYTFSRSLAKSWPSFSWSKLAMNCWQDIFLPMFCNGGMVLPEEQDGAWYGPHSLPCPALPGQRGWGTSRAVMKRLPRIPPFVTPRIYKTLSHSRFYLIFKHHEWLGFSPNPDEGVRLNEITADICQVPSTLQVLYLTCIIFISFSLQREG